MPFFMKLYQYLFEILIETDCGITAFKQGYILGKSLENSWGKELNVY